MTKLEKDEIARLLHEMGQRMALTGGNPYRARAYRTAAENLSIVAEPLDDIIKKDELQTIPGIGEAMTDIIKTLHKTGSHLKLEELRQTVPDGVLALARIPGLRTEQALRIFKETGINNIAALKAALLKGDLDHIKGFTPAFRAKVIQGIDVQQQTEGQRHIDKATFALAAARESIAASDLGLSEITVSGECRRRCELVGELNLVALSVERKADPVIKLGDVTLYVAKPDNYGAVLLYKTGSDKHLAELEELAQAKGFSLSQDGLKRRKTLIAGKTEAEIYKALGLAFVEPELREGRGEIALAARKKLPKLVRLKDLQGILHCHTDRSDGVNTLEEMAEAVRTRGYQYFGVSDHSKSAHYAGGLIVEEILAQHKDVDRLNKKYGSEFRIYKGIESDILEDGSLDYDENILKRFDFIVASVHSRFKLDAASQTKRIIRAVENPFTTILGHMTGRQLLRRPGYEVDIAAILEACANNGVVVEINANPWRLDVDWRWHQAALKVGCLLAINPDAHSTSEIDLVRWGVDMARKGGVGKAKILNCLDRKEFEEFLKERKKKTKVQQKLCRSSLARR